MVKVFFTSIGYAGRYLGEIQTDLQKRLCVTEVSDVQECDVIVALCTIVSRAGTDVEAALNVIPTSKPTLLMVFHHTFNRDDIVPDTQKYVEGRGKTVDLLFNEDQGLLFCRRNEDSKGRAADFLSGYDTSYPRYKVPSAVNYSRIHKVLLLCLLVLLGIIIIELAVYAVIAVTKVLCYLELLNMFRCMFDSISHHAWNMSLPVERLDE